ncbi:MAG: hypothetical protein IKP58_06400 [Victivallales bacterium]|nr:hypothetical protein [Victivallales bacterium]
MLASPTAIFLRPYGAIRAKARRSRRSASSHGPSHGYPRQGAELAEMRFSQA